MQVILCLYVWVQPRGRRLRYHFAWGYKGRREEDKMWNMHVYQKISVLSKSSFQLFEVTPDDVRWKSLNHVSPKN